MDGELPFGFTHTHKRSHAQMELEGSSSPTWNVFGRLAAAREPTPGSSRPRPTEPHPPRLNTMPTQPRRYPGDGMDYRRPVSSNTVIDLTHDDEGAPTSSNEGQQASWRRPRPPRFGRDIMREGVIDLSGDEPRNEAPAPAPASPEIEIISARRIDPPRPSADEDDVEFVRENPLPETLRRHHVNANVNIMHQLLADMNNMRPTPHLEQQMQRRAERQRQATIARIQARIHQRMPEAPRGRHPSQPTFLRPTFDYMAAAFHLGFDFDDTEDEPVIPATPVYNSPPEAAPGYTRSPQEDDSLVCPNCGDELCSGETEQKRQVWIVKNCGHVYCGECTANRSIKKSAKGKEKQATVRTKPFKECVVEGCQKRVSSKTHMFQIFL